MLIDIKLKKLLLLLFDKCCQNIVWKFVDKKFIMKICSTKKREKI